MSLSELVAVAEKLADREKKVLLQIAQRLLTGQEAYGKLTLGKKDWKKEAKEEALDLAVYLSCQLADDAEKPADKPEPRKLKAGDRFYELRYEKPWHFVATVTDVAAVARNPNYYDGWAYSDTKEPVTG